VIELMPHDPRWAEAYEAAAAGIVRALGSTALRVEHVGSTAVPDLVAKPVIDVLVVVERYDPETPYRDGLASLGYVLDHRDGAHVLFRGRHDGQRVQVHVVEEGADEAWMMVAFRDYLRAHPDEARRYGELKQVLAARHWDTAAYAAAKSDYVSEIVRRAS